jgi:hypothetical protein
MYQLVNRLVKFPTIDISVNIIAGVGALRVNGLARGKGMLARAG